MEGLDRDAGDRCAVEERVVDWCGAAVHWQERRVYVDATVGCGGYDAGGDKDTEGNSDDEVRGWARGSGWGLLGGESGLEEGGGGEVFTFQPPKSEISWMGRRRSRATFFIGTSRAKTSDSCNRVRVNGDAPSCKVLSPRPVRLSVLHKTSIDSMTSLLATCSP